MKILFHSVSHSVKIPLKKKINKSWKCFFHPVSLSEEKVFSWGEKKSLTHEKLKFRFFIVLPSVTHEIKDERLNEVFSRKTFFHLVTHVKIPSWKGNFQETTSVKNMFSDFFPSSINWVKKKLGKNKLFIFFFQEKSFLVLVRNWMKKNCFAKKNLFLFNSSQLKKKFLFSFKQEIKVFSWKRNFFLKILFSRVKLS